MEKLLMNIQQVLTYVRQNQERLVEPLDDESIAASLIHGVDQLDLVGTKGQLVIVPIQQADSENMYRNLYLYILHSPQFSVVNACWDKDMSEIIHTSIYKHSDKFDTIRSWIRGTDCIAENLETLTQVQSIAWANEKCAELIREGYLKAIHNSMDKGIPPIEKVTYA